MAALVKKRVQRQGKNYKAHQKKHKKLQDEKFYSSEAWVAVFAVRKKRETESKACKNP